jgi:hypothetical protein
MFHKSLGRSKEFMKKLCTFCFNDGDVFGGGSRAGNRRELLDNKFPIDSPFRMVAFHSRECFPNTFIRYHGGQAGQFEGLAQAHITLSPPSKDLSSCRSGRPEYNAPRLSTRSLRTVPSPPSTRKFWEPTLYETTGPCCLLQRANVLYLSAYLGIRCKCPKIGKAGGPGGSGLRLRERW